MKETPITFTTKKSHDGFQIEYQQLMEVCQGGPEVGVCFVNGIEIEGRRFGGPFIIKDGVAYLPEFQRKFIKSGFLLATIDLRTKKVKNIGKMKPLIFIDQIENGILYFFEDLKQTKKASVKIS